MPADWNDPSVCPDAFPSVAGPQGGAGVNGTNGTNGTNGVDSFTSTSSANWAVPAITTIGQSSPATVTITVLNSAWIGVGQMVYIETAGTYYVKSVPSSTTITLQNIGSAGNAAAATTITGINKVTPGGRDGAVGSSTTFPITIGQGGSGQTTAIASFDALSPLTTLGTIGSLLTYNGTHNVAFPLGATDGMTLIRDSTVTATKLRWGALNLALPAAVTGVLPVVNGGLGASSFPVDALIVGNGSASIRPLQFNFSGTVDPANTDDAGANYSIGSRWYNTVTDSEFVCLDPTTGSAVWASTTTAGVMGVKVKATAVNYTIATSVSLVEVSAINKTITLQTGGAYGGAILTIRDTTGNSVPNITITPFSGQTIDGASSYTITNPNGALSIYWNGTTWKRFNTQPIAAGLTAGGTANNQLTNPFVNSSLVYVASGQLTSYASGVSVPAVITAVSVGAFSGAATGATDSHTTALATQIESLNNVVIDMRTKFNNLLTILHTLNVVTT